MRWLRQGGADIAALVVTVGRHWFGLLGGTMIGTIWLFEAAQGKDLPQQFAKAFFIAGIPLALVLALWEQYKELKRLTKKVRLELRFQPIPPYVQERRTHFYLVGVYNHGPGVAENVQVTLLSLDPRPRYPAYQGRFPWHLGLPIADSMATPQAGYVPGRAINEHEEVCYEFADAWRSAPPDSRLIIAGLDGADVRGAGLQSFRYCAMADDERWELRIAVSAANAERQVARLILLPDGERLNITLEADTLHGRPGGL